MSERWTIKTDWALLETGSPEERAGFAAIGISAYGTWLTAGHDRLLQSVREASYLSAYHFAEWLAWNWWRLRWEPRRSSTEWELSHSMSSIGSGYIWPNIHIVSDGQNVTLVCKPTPERARTPYRYINDAVSILPAAEFENEVDLFIETVLQRLRDCQIGNSNLQDIWQTVLKERQDPSLQQRRKIEALLGEDSGEMDEIMLRHILDNAGATGLEALEEIAANRIPGQDVPDIAGLLELGKAEGASADSRDRITLQNRAPKDPDAAWKLGTRAAQLLREQEQLAPDMSLTNDRLAQMYGTSGRILEAPTQPTSRVDLSFDLAESEQRSKVLLRSRWSAGRRFELARLLGDSLLCVTNDPMRPVTRSDTYRQKMQRAFAAELLSPFQAVDAMLAGDYSMESQQDVAHHFQVSDMTIRTLMVNHARIDRSELDETDWAAS